MKRITLSAAALIAMLSATPEIVAQGTESTQNATTTAQQDKKMSLSLQDAINYALEHNRELKNASLDVQKAEMQRWQTIAQMLPQIDASLTYVNMLNQELDMSSLAATAPVDTAALSKMLSADPNDKDLNDLNRKMTKIENSKGYLQMQSYEPTKMNDYGQLGISVSAGLSAQGIIGAQMQRIAKEISEINVQKSQQETKYQVESTYTTILALEETVRLLETNMENLEKMKSMTENAVKAGVAEQNDANQISIQVASMKSAVNTTKRQIESLYNALILNMGADSDVEITLTQKLDEVVNAGTIIELVSSNLDLNQNLDYQMLSKSTEITDKQKQMAVAAFFPTVGVQYNYAKKNYFEAEKNFDMSPKHTIAAAINVPIFSSGKRTCAVKEAKIAQIEQANTVENAEVGLKIQEKQLKYNLTSAFENYNIQKDNIQVMTSVFNSYGEKFKYGRASSMDVTNSSINLTQAQSNYINSVLEMVNANIELKKLLNK
ncbi:MAG: TolC family protein [Paludibacteraceae bacterium]|nr:TolC family protein [Paludibacteraceae bacterium]